MEVSVAHIEVLGDKRSTLLSLLLFSWLVMEVETKLSIFCVNLHQLQYFTTAFFMHYHGTGFQD